jgi:hypothetical protein
MPQNIIAVTSDDKFVLATKLITMDELQSQVNEAIFILEEAKNQVRLAEEKLATASADLEAAITIKDIGYDEWKKRTTEEVQQPEG